MSRIISGERVLDAPQLAQNVERAARGFAALGVGPGDAVVLLMRNDFAFIEASLAAQHIGAYATPLNWHGVADDVAFILGDCSAQVLVAHADLLAPVRHALPPELDVLVVETPPEIAAAYGLAPSVTRPAPDARLWSEWLLDHAEGPLPPAAPPTTAMIYTSGTTGRPKGVRRSAMSLEQRQRQLEMLAQAYGLVPGAPMTVLVNGPMYHTAPNAYAMQALAMGADLVLQARFDAAEMLELIAGHAVTHMHVVPTMFVRLSKLPPAVQTRHDLSSLRFVAHGAAPCPVAIKQQMIAWWGPVIHEYYGSTETGITACHDSVEALRKPGTVGRALPGSVIQIFGDSGEPLPAGEVGDIYVRSGGMSDFTYHGRDEQRREIARGDLITVGDMGWMDEDGYLFLCDRRRDMIISGGVNIYPAEIEAALVGVPGVRDCAVFGVPDEEFGEAVCAYVEPDGSATLTAESLRTALDGRLARFKVPRIIEFRPKLPREDSGKIFKRRLREPYWAQLSRSI